MFKKMNCRTYFPKFIARWNENIEGLEIRAIDSIVSFKGMDANMIRVFENLCSGENSLQSIIDLLSVEWDREQLDILVELFIKKQIIIDVNKMNKFTKSGAKKIETIFPNKDILENFVLDYQIIYGRADLDVWSCGKDKNLAIAKQKLISEIIEWNIWSSLEKVHYAYMNDLDENVIHPKEIVSYSDVQYDNTDFIFKKFDEKNMYGWLKVKNITKNKNMYVLAEHILYPYCHDNLYTRSTSSGCAAHVKRSKVTSHAIFELIERDAFMIFWLNKLTMPTLEISSLPESLKNRVIQIQDLGYVVVIKNIGLDLAPVVLVSVRSKMGEYVTCGIASSCDAESMINAALSEVEVTIMHLLNLNRRNKESITPKDVEFLEQHEELYQQIKYSYETDFMFSDLNRFLFPIPRCLHRSSSRKSCIITTW